MNTSMSRLAELAWSQFWQICAVALVVGLVARLFCRRRPHLAYLLWMIVIVKCLTPPLWSSPIGVFSWTRMDRLTTASRNSAASVTLPSTGFTPAISAGAAILGQDIPMQPTNWLQTANVVGAIWLAGTAAYAGFVVVNLVVVSLRLRRSLVAIDSTLSTRMVESSRRLRVGRSVRLVVTTQPVGPAVYGIIRPTLVLPQALLSAKPLVELEPILAHELIHIRRGDTLAAMLQLVAQCLWWFHPLVWWANRQVCRERERSCDEEVLAGLKCDPAAYGQGLLDIVRLKKKLRPMLAYPGVRSGEVTSRRLEHIMQNESRFHLRTPLPYWVLALVGTVAALPGAGFAVDSPMPGGDPKGEQVTLNDAIAGEDRQSEPNFYVLPIKTALQRSFLVGGDSLKAYVGINGSALLGKRGDELMRAIDAPALKRTLAAIRGSDQEPQVVFSITFGQIKPEDRVPVRAIIDPAKVALEAIARESRIRVARVDERYHYDGYDWTATVAAIKAIDFEKDNADEPGIGDEVVKAYPVRTKTSRFMVNVDCVVRISQSLDGVDQPVISPKLQERVKSAVSKLDLQKKNKILFSFVGHTRNSEAINQALVQVHDETGKNEIEKLADLLGFKGSSMSL
jgi:beta-lactamase regulating signal transducer with metallopeptidase domain